jgi:hypothetical protein
MKHPKHNIFASLSSTIPAGLSRALLMSGLCLGVGSWYSVATFAAEKTAPKPAPANAAPTTPGNNPTPPAPAQLVNWVKQLDAAASRKDIAATLKFYSPNFTHQDGLTYQAWEQSLQNTWKTLQTVQYQTRIDQWKAEPGNRYTLETTTTITGTKQSQGRELKLTSTLRARQQIAQQQVTRLEILSEKTQMVSGAKPPAVTVNLPEQVKVGQPFDFDVVLQEPLGDQLLLGAALEEPITAENYLKAGEFKLEPLTAGGLFKVGRAPTQPTRQWVSAVLIQEGGMTVISQRLNVVASLPTSTQPTK